jgi:uncharacterized membrane-anchored protein
VSLDRLRKAAERESHAGSAAGSDSKTIRHPERSAGSFTTEAQSKDLSLFRGRRRWEKTGALPTASAHGMLSTIAQKYYKNKGRWKDIQDANFNSLEGTVKIKPGMTLIIP